MPGLIVPRLRPAGEIRWLREEDPETIATWAEYAEPGSVEAELDRCLLISDRELVGTAVYLLNPARRHGEEWEAVHLAHWSPGAERFRSFRELLEEERRRFNAPADPTVVRGRELPGARSSTVSAGAPEGRPDSTRVVRRPVRFC